MTIDEAISHAMEVAEGLEKKANTYGIKQAYIPKSREPVDCISCAAEHRQLAEWLTELKEAKRLLGKAMKAFNDGSCNKDCRQCKWNGNCEMSCRFAWIHTDEALKLIGDDIE